MKRLQESAAAKVCAVIVLVGAVFGTGVFGVRTILGLPFFRAGGWQDTRMFYNALAARKGELEEGIGELYYWEAVLAGVNAAGTVLDPSLETDAEVMWREWKLRLEERFGREDTWFRFRIVDEDTGGVLWNNLEEGQSLAGAVKGVYSGALVLDYSNYYRSELESEIVDRYMDGAVPGNLKLEYGVPEQVDSSIYDEFFQAYTVWNNEQLSFGDHAAGFWWLGVLALLALAWTLWSAGHRAGTEGIALTWQEKIFFELYAAAVIGAAVLLGFAAVWAVEQFYCYPAWSLEDSGGVAELALYGTAGLFSGAALAVCLTLRTLAVRLKAGTLAKTTLLCRVAGWTVRTVHEFVQDLPVTWKAVLGFGFYTVLTIFLMAHVYYDGFLLMLYLCLQLVLLFFISWWTYGYHRLRQGTKTIAKGDLEYQIDTRRMPHDLRLQAEDLNNISVGLSGAVEEKIKSERFKAELITNVSHDLKTPLTSIINYVNLLKSTEQSDPKAVEYIEVLDRKSQRLKKLTEDLVEASKASTGALTVNREKIGMGQLIDQALGEWEEKLSDRKLTLVTTLPEGETWVYADGRHLWRVLDNLLSNCAKYAMEGTRVYLDLERGKGQVVLSVKNISREPLNIPAERLMERFVRGEESRSTEGSGLGLSIARSLTKLQGGAFALTVDGDLFKAIVTLPQAN